MLPAPSEDYYTPLLYQIFQTKSIDLRYIFFVKTNFAEYDADLAMKGV